MTTLKRIPVPDAIQMCVLAAASILQGAAWTRLAISATAPAAPTAATTLAAVGVAVALTCGAHIVPFMYLEPRWARRVTIAANTATIAGAWTAASLIT